MELYTKELYKADGAYRKYVIAWNKANPYATGVNDDLQNEYEAYQQDLGRAWQTQIDTLSQWLFTGVDSQ